MPKPSLPPLAGALVLLLAGCTAPPAAGSSTAGQTSPSSGTIAVVASTDVWGDVVEQIGGDAVTVTSILRRAGQNPHEYEATARDQLAVRRARLVVVNGGGYDDFMTRLRATAGGAPVITAATVSGRLLAPGRGEFNEHLWYDLPTARRMAAAVATQLARIAPAKRAVFERARQRFDAAVAALEEREAAVRRTAAGKGVAITEAVPLYLTEACGLVNRTPKAFSAAVEAGSDVAPAVLQRQLALLTDHRVALLVVNAQTASPTTDRVVAVARAARVPVVVARETLPPGKGYLAWMSADIGAIERAVR